MHELQLMRQVVHMVECACREQPAGTPTIVRLQISGQSHLAEHTTLDLEATFHMAAKGSRAQAAKLEVVTVIANGSCQRCSMIVERSSDTVTCPRCGSGNIAWDDQPEVLLQDIEYVEERS